MWRRRAGCRPGGADGADGEGVRHTACWRWSHHPPPPAFLSALHDLQPAPTAASKWTRETGSSQSQCAHSGRTHPPAASHAGSAGHCTWHPTRYPAASVGAEPAWRWCRSRSLGAAPAQSDEETRHWAPGREGGLRVQLHPGAITTPVSTNAAAVSAYRRGSPSKADEEALHQPESCQSFGKPLTLWAPAARRYHHQRRHKRPPSLLLDPTPALVR
ncbi:uncharacterized protein BDZ99DRAFT_518496 [Mytilinidion resinicola]|uniref:Uncharacterized protein n=1 Tax=Mytilinidion resinicola TaxID=574789 RepID=A0A6A6YWB7_9PEZI|nr:uncharacterized protein BDZ99DRAFT_518496 [Mytilinidion resinicola]KAF2812683.1 hypothetical protein BDZ99DRAFT_518496 [Mytilinidion resinicola]